MKRITSTIRFVAVLSLVALGFVLPASARSGNPGAGQPAPAGGAGIIYVTDFALDAGDVSQDRSRILPRPGRLLGNSAPKPEELVETLSDSLVKELQGKSIQARRLYPGQPVPPSGWVISGQFLEVGEGNRLRRAAIGFGAGASEMQVEVTVADLTRGAGEPFLVFGTDNKSGRGPGAVVMMNPYAAAAKFVLSKKATSKDIRKTAKDIASVIAQYMEDTGTAPR